MVEVSAAADRPPVPDGRQSAPADTEPTAAAAATSAVQADGGTARWRPAWTPALPRRSRTRMPAGRRRGMSLRGMLCHARRAARAARRPATRPMRRSRCSSALRASARRRPSPRLRRRSGPGTAAGSACVAADGFRVGAVEQLRLYADISGRRSPWRARRTSCTCARSGRQSGAGRHRRPIALGRRARADMLRAWSSRARTCARTSWSPPDTPVQTTTRILDAIERARPARWSSDEGRRSRVGGAALRLPAERDLPVSYLGVGQRVPDDLRRRRRARTGRRGCSAPRTRRSGGMTRAMSDRLGRHAEVRMRAMTSAGARRARAVPRSTLDHRDARPAASWSTSASSRRWRSRLAQRPAVAGRDVRPDQRRRDRAHRRRRPLQADAGVPFDAFARRRVQGAMLDALRDLDWAPRSLRRLRREVDAAIARLRRRAGARARRGTKWPREMSMSPAEYDKAHRPAPHAGRRRHPPARRHRRRRLSRCSSCASIRTKGPDAQLERKELRELLARAHHGTARTRTADSGALLRRRDDDGRDRRGHRRLRIARVAAAVARARPGCAPLREGSAQKRSADDEQNPVAGRDRRAARRRPTALQTPGAEEPAPTAVGRRYNFRRPDRVSKEQIRSLHFLHDRFARNISTSLSAYLRAVTEVSVVSVEQFTYSEFLMSLPDPTAFYAISLPPIEGVGRARDEPVGRVLDDRPDARRLRPDAWRRTAR